MRALYQYRGSCFLIWSSASTQTAGRQWLMKEQTWRTAVNIGCRGPTSYIFMRDTLKRKQQLEKCTAAAAGAAVVVVVVGVVAGSFLSKRVFRGVYNEQDGRSVFISAPPSSLPPSHHLFIHGMCRDRPWSLMA